ncbi:IS630 family transposase [Methylomonas lenta]|uniref:IS630 family transposase n=1 Tax=Methylomonas lenta TaxID=980561 RepID=UPI000832C77B
MLQPTFTEKEIAHLYQLFMKHPSRATKKKLHVVYLKALGLPHQEINRIARVSSDSVTRYLKAYIEGGLGALCSSQHYCPRSALLPHAETLKTHFKTNPPHTVAQAAYEIEAIVGIKLALSACRDFMRKHLGMKCRKMAVIPSKADPDKQSEFLHGKLEPLLEEEKQGKRRVFFVDAAHFVMGAFLGMLWCFERLFLKSSAGRNRYNVLGAYSVQGSELITIANNTYINSDTLVTLLTTLREVHADTAITLVLDNARYQRCDKVINKALELDIDLQFLPPYSPNLNLIERLWKFTKKQCLYNRYYETFFEFKTAIDDCLDKVNSTFNAQVKSLLNPRFQLFQKSANVTA